MKSPNSETDAYNIAHELVKQFPGKLISKANIPIKYNLPYLRGREVIKRLEFDYGFENIRNNFRIPVSLPEQMTEP